MAAVQVQLGQNARHVRFDGFDANHQLFGDLLVRLALGQQLEHIALTDQHFIDRKLYPNVDFYSGIILEAIGFPTSMFTAIFALSRTVGWIAQWKEMIADPQKKIGRPRQLYHGAPARDYVPVAKR